MNGLDRMFLNAESDKLPMDNVGIFLLDPSTSPDDHDFERVKAELAIRIPRIPIFTRRPVAAPLALGGEQWAIDPEFSIDRHVFEVSVPEACDLEGLERVVLDDFSDPLPRDRPLWQIGYVSRLKGGGAALLFRVHHAVLDGVGGMEMLAELLAIEPLPLSAAPEPTVVRGERVPGGVEMLLRSVPIQVNTPVKLIGAVAPLAGSIAPQAVRVGLTKLGILRRSDDDRELAAMDEGGGNRSGPTPKTVLNEYSTSGARSLGLMSIPMDDITTVKRRHGVTVNDVVLAIVSGGVNDYLRARGRLPGESMRILAPVNVRADDDAESDGGNHFTFMLVPVGTAPIDPVDHLKDIAAQTAQRRPKRSTTKTSSAPSRSSGAAGRIVEALPSALWSAVGLVTATPVLTLAPPVANYVVSNIPGPPIDVYFAGARITHLYGRTMAGAGVGLFTHCISYAGKLDFGFTAVEQLVPDMSNLVRAITASAQALVDASR